MSLVSVPAFLELPPGTLVSVSFYGRQQRELGLIVRTFSEHFGAESGFTYVVLTRLGYFNSHSHELRRI